MAESSRVIVRMAVLAAALLALVPEAIASQRVTHSLAGTVRDSLTGQPLPGARVELVPAAARESAGYQAEADATGR
jgi:pyocin large subunit-like protein